MRSLNKNHGVVWGSALVVAAMAATVMLCPASASASQEEGPSFGDLGISYVAGSYMKLESKNTSRWKDVQVRTLYLAAHAQEHGEKRTDGPWKGYHLWTAEDLYGSNGRGLITVPGSGAWHVGSNTSTGCSKCTMVGVKGTANGGETYDLL